MPSDPDDLNEELRRTESALDEALDEACEEGMPREDTGDLIRLEELLHDAADTAKEAVTLRRRMRAEGRRRGEASGSARRASDREGGADAVTKPESETVREVRDADGQSWRVWEVRPDQLDRRRPWTYAGDFEGGWLCFEALDGEERRRLPSYPADWRAMDAKELASLLAAARPAPIRRPKGTDRESTGEGKSPPGPGKPPEAREPGRGEQGRGERSGDQREPGKEGRDERGGRGPG